MRSTEIPTAFLPIKIIKSENNFQPRCKIPLKIGKRLVFQLRPLFATITACLAKSPKLYWTDPGLARLLSERMGLAGGFLFETAVAGALQYFFRFWLWQISN
jgi:hypothetical protein